MIWVLCWMMIFSWKCFVLADATHSMFECYSLTDGVIPILLQFILIMYVNMQTTAGTVLADFHLKFKKILYLDFKGS